MNNHNIPTETNTMLDILRNVLDKRLIAVYLHGSAVLGGLRKDSDIDVLAIVNDGISDDERNALTAELMKTSGRIGNSDGRRCLELIVVMLSDIVPWIYPPKSLYQYGEWLREKIERGWIPQARNDPDLAIILSQAQQHSIALLGSDISGLIPQIPKDDLLRALRDCLPGFVNNIKGDERNVLLSLARIWATAAIGEFLPKDRAAAWAVARLPQEHSAPLMLALSAYRGEEADNWDNLDLSAIVEILRTNIDALISNEQRKGDNMWKCPKCGKEFKNTNQSHYCVKPADIDDYIAGQPTEVQPVLQKVRATIHAAAPDAMEKISWSMPTFTWKGKNIVNFCAHKNHIGIHPGAVEQLEPFADRLAAYKTTKGAIQFPYGRVDYDLIADIIRWRVSVSKDETDD